MMLPKFVLAKHMAGIIGLKSALAEAAEQCKDMSDDSIGKILLEKLSERNYIVRSVAAAVRGLYFVSIKSISASRSQKPPVKVLDINSAEGLGAPSANGWNRK